MTDNTLSTETSGDTLSAAEQAYFSSRGEDTSGLGVETPQEGGSPAEQAKVETPAGSQEPAGDDIDLEDGDTIVVLGKDGKPRDGKNGQFVSQKALHAVREKYKATRDELAAERQKAARADERLAVLNEILTKADDPAKTTQSAEVPDPEKDPIGYIAHLQKQVKALQDKEVERQRLEADRANSRTLKSAFEKDAIAYIKDQPDFLDAYKFVLSQRRAELTAWGHDSDAINEMIASEERGIIANAFQAKKSPSQLIYRMAEARGYKKAAPVDPKDGGKAESPSPMEKIDALAKAQQAAGAGLSGAGGSPGEGLTREALANMSEEEFAATTAKLSKARLRELMGG